MSVNRETIAEYYHVEPDEIRCDRCQYGAGEFLVECGLWSHVMGAGEFCSFWTKDGELPQGLRKEEIVEAKLPSVIENKVVEKLKEAYLKPLEGGITTGVEDLLQGPSKRRRR